MFPEVKRHKMKTETSERLRRPTGHQKGKRATWATRAVFTSWPVATAPPPHAPVRCSLKREWMGEDVELLIPLKHCGEGGYN